MDSGKTIAVTCTIDVLLVRHDATPVGPPAVSPFDAGGPVGSPLQRNDTEATIPCGQEVVNIVGYVSHVFEHMDSKCGQKFLRRLTGDM